MNRTDTRIPTPTPGRNGRGHDAVVAKLSRFASLSSGDIRVLEALCSNEEHADAGVNLAEEGNETSRGCVIRDWPVAIG